jgi:hypothetical protein
MPIHCSSNQWFCGENHFGSSAAHRQMPETTLEIRSRDEEERSAGGGRLRMTTALFHFLWTLDVIFLAYYFANDYIIRQPDAFRLFNLDGTPFNSHDGQWYKSIANFGYFYTPGSPSNVAFFPFYPLCCRLVVQFTGLSYDDAALFVSNGFLAGCFLLLGHYLNLRFYDTEAQIRRNVMLSFAVFPTTFFFRMGYSESCFIFFLLVYMILLLQKCNPFLLALTAGLLTAVRSPGIAAIPTTILYLWHREPQWSRFAGKSIIIIPLSCWGLISFMSYQYFKFNDLFAFARAQDNFKGRPTPPMLEKALALISFEPIRALLDPATSTWARHVRGPLFNLGAADPLIFVLAFCLVAYGSWRRVLNRNEFILSVSLLLITYVAIGYESYMRSQGRYASAIIPMYMVIGHLLSRNRGTWSVPLLSLSTLFFFIYACLFLSGYFVV